MPSWRRPYCRASHPNASVGGDDDVPPTVGEAEPIVGVQLGEARVVRRGPTRDAGRPGGIPRGQGARDLPDEVTHLHRIEPEVRIATGAGAVLRP